jgi:hypothetical protein
MVCLYNSGVESLSSQASCDVGAGGVILNLRNGIYHEHKLRDLPEHSGWCIFLFPLLKQSEDLQPDCRRVHYPLKRTSC